MPDDNFVKRIVCQNRAKSYFQNAFMGGFDSSSNPLDNYIYFVCAQSQENALQSASVNQVSLRVNNTLHFDLNANEWRSCDCLYLGKEQVNLRNGDEVTLYLDGYEVAKWICDISHPVARSIENFVINRWNSLPESKRFRIYGSLVKNVFKIILR